jgi:glycosyltransferase involved in cell wall biosynthesis
MGLGVDQQGRRSGKADQMKNQENWIAPDAPRITHHVSRITFHASRFTHHPPLPIRVVRIIDRLNIGGPAKHVTWLAAGLSDDEFATTLITGTVPPGEGDMSYFAREAGVTPLVIDQMSRELRPRDVLVIARLVRQLFKLRPQIVHTHKAKAGATGRVAAMIYRWLTPSALWLRPRSCKIVHTYHGHIFHSYYGGAKTRLFIAIERALARLCTDRIVVIGDQQRHEICERFGVGRAAQFRIVPLGLDLDEIKERRGPLREELGIADDEIAIGIVGRLCEVKHHAMLFEAARLVAQACPASRIRFVVVGDGHLRGGLEDLSQKLGIAERVNFTGFRRDATSLYGEFDIVALTSLNEGTPLTLIEAMGCGRAIAATEVGAVVDVMGERRLSQSGFTVWDHGVTAASRDAAGFASALRFLIEQPELRRQMGARGRVFVRTRLLKERLINDIKEVYRELIGVAAEAPSTHATQSLAQSQ